MLLDLTILPGLTNRLKSDGADLRVTDTGNNLMPSDLVYYTNGTGLLVMNPGVKHTGNQTFRFWYGNDIAQRPHFNSLYGQWNTYPDYIRAYYPTGAGLDRTRNARHLNLVGTSTGVVGMSSGFSGCSYAASSSSSGLIGNATGLPLTMLTWVKMPPTSDETPLMSLSNDGSNVKSHVLRKQSAITNQFRMWSTAFSASSAPRGIPNNRWAYIGGVSSGNASGIVAVNTIISGLTGTMSRSAGDVPDFPSLPTGLLYITINSYPTFGDTFSHPQAFCLTQYHSGMRNLQWVRYDYLMGVDQSGFWGGVSAGTVGMGGASAVNTSLTDIYGVDRGLLGGSNTVTYSVDSLNMFYGLGANSNTVTRYIGTLDIDELLALSLEGVISTTTSSRLSINLAITFNVVSSTRTHEISNVSLLKQLQAYINTLTKTEGSATVTRNLSILSTDETRTSTTCSLDIESSSINGIVRVLTKLAGTLSLTGESNGEIVEFPVYITLNSEGNFIITRNHATVQTIIGEG